MRKEIHLKDRKNTFIVLVVTLLLFELVVLAYDYLSYRSSQKENIDIKGQRYADFLAQIAIRTLHEYYAQNNTLNPLEQPVLEGIVFDLVSYGDVLDATVFNAEGERFTRTWFNYSKDEGLYYRTDVRDPMQDNKLLGYVQVVLAKKYLTEEVHSYLFWIVLKFFMTSAIISFVVVWFYRRLKKLEQSVIHSERLTSVGQMAAGIAHEVKNPLAIINGQIYLLRQELVKFLPEKTSSLLDPIDIAIKRINQVVQGMCKHARIDTDSGVSEFDLFETVRDFNSLVARFYIPAKVQFDVFISPVFQTKRPMVMGDDGRFNQVLTNLISNARDAVEATQEPKVTITLQNEPKAVKLIVADNGMGIPKHMIDKIFNPFFTTKPPGKGTGIGLDIVNSIIHEMGGKIEVSSMEKMGTEFVITLPARYQATSSPESKENNSHIETPSTQRKIDLKSKRILVVDDEEDIRLILRSLLEDMGAEVSEAMTGIEALSILSRGPFDLMVADLTMPGFGGEKLFAQIPEDKKEMKLVCCTGLVDVVFEDKKIEILAKPFTAAELIKVVSDALRKD